MSDNKGDTQKQQPLHQQQHLSTPPDQGPDQESTHDTNPQQQRQSRQQSPAVVVAGVPFVSLPAAPLCIPSAAHVPSGSAFEQQHQPQYEALNPKRPRFTATQWKLISSPSPQQKQSPSNILTTESSPSPIQPQTVAASSSDTASSPSHSPLASHSAAEATKPEPSHSHQQFRKGKYVSPVWKPNEMLWLARAWRVQYQQQPGGGSDSFSSSSLAGASAELGPAAAAARGKTRADKDREVAEFLNRHGVNRDAKTAGTKWDNMLGEFRKVYEWERGGGSSEGEQVWKSYFRLSPFERKLHRLPASFDEDAFEELSQFMGPRIKTSHGRSINVSGGGGEDGRSALTTTATKFLLPPPPYPYKEELPLSGRAKQLLMSSSGSGEAFVHGARGDILGFETSLGHHDVGAPPPSSMICSKELRRIGKIKMLWEESVSLWAEVGEHHRGRVKIQGSSFLNADEITFLDDSMVACTMEAFEDGPLKGFSVDRFLTGQQVKVFGRRKSFSTPISSGSNERIQLPPIEPSIRSIPQWEFQDPSDYYLGCLRVPPQTLPSLLELSWQIQELPPEELRFPLRKDVYKDLPQGKEQFFTTSSSELVLDCRAIAYDILSPVMRSNPSLSGSTSTSRDSFIGIWDDCINRIVAKFSSIEMVFVRKPSSPLAETIQDQWPNLTAFLKNFCVWRGEETDELREGTHHIDPSISIVEKLLWTFTDLPYILGYYAVGYVVTFCAISRSQDHRIIRTDLYTVDLSNPVERLKALIPCWRIAGLLSLLADRCINGNSTYSDFERNDLGNGNIMEMTPNTAIRFFPRKRKWASVKEIYEFLDRRIPHADFIVRSSEKDLALVFKPRGCSKLKPTSCDQLIEALKHVTKALVALHDLSFMHRDLGWEKVMKRSDRENEWFITGFDEAVSAPQIYPHNGGGASGRDAPPEMGRGLHGVKVDVWGVGQLVKTCGLVGLPKLLRELQNRCLDHNPEQRPTAADCYHHLLQLQSSMSAAATGGY